MSRDFHEKAEQYLQGAMSSSEAAEFEALLRENQDLQEEFQVISDLHRHFNGDAEAVTVPENAYTQSIRTILKSKEANDIKKELRRARNTYERDKKNSVCTIRIVLSIIFIIMIACTLYFFTNQKSEDLYAQYYDPSDLPSMITRSGGDTNVEKAVIAFQNQNFAESLKLLDQSKDTLVQKEIPYLLYYGVASLENGNWTQALTKFDAVINSNSIDRSKGYWFKALVYLKMGDKENAINLLNEIKTHRDYFNHTKARKLLDHITR